MFVGAMPKPRKVVRLFPKLYETELQQTAEDALGHPDCAL